MVVSTWVRLTRFYYEKHTFPSSLTCLFTLPLCRPTVKNENLGISWWARWAQDGSGRTQNICFQMYLFFSPNVIYFCSIVCLSTENKQIYKPTMHTFDVRCLELRLNCIQEASLGLLQRRSMSLLGSKLKGLETMCVFHVSYCWEQNTRISVEWSIKCLSTWFWSQILRRTWKRNSSWPPQDGRWKCRFRSGPWGGKKITFWIFNDFPTAAALLMGLLHTLNKGYPRCQRYTCEVIQKVLMDIGGRQCCVLVYGLRKKLLRMIVLA